MYLKRYLNISSFFVWLQQIWPPVHESYQFSSHKLTIDVILKAMWKRACHWPESFGHLDMASAVMNSCKCTIYPRRLVAESHRRFLPGKTTATSKASNLSLRRLAICDVAAIVSTQCISGTGLSRARLINRWYAALRYHSGQYCPQHLLAGMVEYGVSFATFEPLDA